MERLWNSGVPDSGLWQARFSFWGDSHTGIDDAGLQALADSAHFPALASLVVYGSLTSDDGLPALRDSAHWPRLTILSSKVCE